MNENDTIRELLEAALRKLEGSRVERSIAEPTGADRTSTQSSASQTALQPASPSASHPGLERFTIIESESNPPGQKTCYMEPDRPCVKSGACEMRGY
jgi:hypothetical protein